MAKTIKFNLILDGKPVRDIKGLQENFCIDDILDIYQKGLLQKWLKVRGYDEYLKKVEGIDKNKPAIIELIKIFNIEKSDVKIREAIYSLDFWEQRKLELEEWNKKDIKVKKIISDYHNGYDDLGTEILEKKDNYPFLKSAAKELWKNYSLLLQVDFKRFFYEMKDNNPLFLFTMFSQKEYRESGLFTDWVKKELFSIIPQKQKVIKFRKDTNKEWEIVTNNNCIITDCYDSSGHLKIKNKNKEFKPKDILGEVLEGGFEFSSNSSSDEVLYQEVLPKPYKTFAGDTEQYWKDLEVLGTKVMVFKIPNRTYIRNANKPKEELSAKEVNGEFLILNGLVYKSNNSDNEIIYMEL